MRLEKHVRSHRFEVKHGEGIGCDLAIVIRLLLTIMEDLLKALVEFDRVHEVRVEMCRE